MNPHGEGTLGRNREGEVVLVWGDPKPEGVGLGFSSSLPVLPGVGVALRLAPSLRPPPPTPKPTPVRPPSAELSPAVCRLHSPGALAPVQGGPGWLQRQESQGLRPARPSPVSPGCPSTSPQQTQDLLSSTGGLLQGALPDGPCFPWARLTLVCSQSFNSENRATLSFSLGLLKGGHDHAVTPPEVPYASASLLLSAV